MLLRVKYNKSDETTGLKIYRDVFCVFFVVVFYALGSRPTHIIEYSHICLYIMFGNILQEKSTDHNTCKWAPLGELWAQNINNIVLIVRDAKWH